MNSYSYFYSAFHCYSAEQSEKERSEWSHVMKNVIKTLYHYSNAISYALIILPFVLCVLRKPAFYESSYMYVEVGNRHKDGNMHMKGKRLFLLTVNLQLKASYIVA